MTPQEAINIIEDVTWQDNGRHYGKIVPAREIAISTLERQIPTKITHEATLYKCCTCPNCKNVVDEFIDFQGKKTRVTPSYCKYCGQALDWSDTE